MLLSSPEVKLPRSTGSEETQQHRLYDQIAAERLVARRRSPNILADFSAGLGKMLRRFPERQAEIAEILRDKR